jgi:hypothetical protein
MPRPLNIAIVIGSTRQGRFAPIVANWFAGQGRVRDDMGVDVIDLADASLPDVLTQHPGPEVAAVKGEEELCSDGKQHRPSRRYHGATTSSSGLAGEGSGA